MVVFKGGEGELLENEITRNGRSGVTVETGSAPCVEKNTITHNERYGVHYYSEGMGRLVNNDINNNKASGICYESGARPLNEYNRVIKNADVGVLLREDDKTLHKNIIKDNKIFRY